ncbi:MAG: diacylglycerol kinase [Candidatus Omnitrophota bacterium]
MQRRSLIESFNDAIEGFIYVLRTQKNMRFHFLFGMAVFVSGILLGFTKTEILVLGMTVAFVLLSEMVNTALEMTLDLFTDKYNQMVRIIKDICAGAVLIASINALIVGYLLFIKPVFEKQFDVGIRRIVESPWHITAINIVIVMALVVVGKVFFHKGTPMRGGMPSGHAALSFAIWAMIVFVTKNTLVIFLVFFLALMVAQSRIIRHIHTVWEVVAGALLGVLSTVLIFQLLK